MRVTAGYGDPCTWGPCMGHPNDPRTDVDAENAAFESWAEDQYKDCPYEKALIECAFSDFNPEWLPEKYVKESAEEKTAKEIVFFLFPSISSPLKEALEQWVSMIREEKFFTLANRAIKDILFEKGRESLVQCTEQSHRASFSKILEHVNEGEVTSVYNSAVDLFNIVAREIAKGEIVNEAEDLYDSLEDRWNQRGRYEYGRPDYD